MVTVSFLKEIVFFHSFNKTDCAAVIRNSTQENFKKGEIIFREGEYGDALFIILSGEVVIEKEPLIKETGLLSTLHLTRGDFFGELAIFDGGPRTSTARAIEDTQVISLTQTMLFRLFRKKPALASRFFKNMLQIIASRVRSTNKELMAFYEIGRLLSTTHTQNSLFENVLKILIAASGAERGLILMKNPVTRNLEIVGIQGENTEKTHEEDIINSALVAKVLSEGNPLITEKGVKTDKEITDITFAKEEAILAVPFGAAEEKRGVVILTSLSRLKDSKPNFTDNDAVLVQAVMHQIETALENIRFQIEAEGRQKLQRHYFNF
ncbi:MAG: cyclic nucleotide-binding domain-containing protein [Candidatus Omnitrophota bacterium]